MYYFVSKQRNTVRFAHVSCDFISLYLFVLTFAMKLRDDNYKSHWNVLVIYDQLKMSDLNMSPAEMSDFVSFPLFGFSAVIKLRISDFESHWNNSLFFNKKRYGVRFEYILWKNVWFYFISNVWVHFSRKTEKFRFWRSLIFLDKKMMSDLIMSGQTMSDLV